jgi:hypothetical protein
LCDALNESDDGCGGGEEGGLYSWGGAGGHEGDGEVCRVRGRQCGDPCRVGRWATARQAPPTSDPDRSWRARPCCLLLVLGRGGEGRGGEGTQGEGPAATGDAARDLLVDDLGVVEDISLE